jgi:hypothetical protein
MWKRIKENFDSGADKVRWFSSLMNERMKVELSLFKLLYKTTEMEKNRASLMKTIGERVFELRNASEKRILRDPAILEALESLEKLDSEIADMRRKASEIEKIEA